MGISEFPWYVDTKDRIGFTVRSLGGKPVAEIWQNGDDAEAAACLIAAAPNLLEALQLHVAYEAIPTDRGGSQGPKGKAWTAYVEARDAAIKKAKGL